MAVTLNFTSKGLIHAIRTQLEQQKKEGKISGDTSYKNIATCDFWSTLKEINDKHDKKNKVFHGKSYGCEDKGKNTDWTKTIVVYGSTTLSDEEWESLIQSMGLQLAQKAEQPKVEEPKAEEVKQTEVKTEEPSTPTEEKKKFAMPIATMAALMTVLEDVGYKNSTQATDLIQTKLNCNVVLNENKEIKIYNTDGKELTKKDENGKTIFSKELREALDSQIQKEAAQKAAEETKTNIVTNTEIEEDDENCIDDEEE